MLKKRLDDFVGNSLARNLKSLDEAISNTIKNGAPEVGGEEQATLRHEIDESESELRAQYPNYNDLVVAAARQRVAFNRYRSQIIDMFNDEMMGFLKEASSAASTQMAREFPGVDALSIIQEALRSKSKDVLAMVDKTTEQNVKFMSAMFSEKARYDTKRAMAYNAAKGARGRADKYEPLKERAIALAANGNYHSARNAAINIAPIILEMQEAKTAGLSSDRAEQTIADWLRKAGVDFSRQQ